MTTTQMEKMVLELQESNKTTDFASLVADVNWSLKDLITSNFKSLYVQLSRDMMNRFANAVSYLIKGSDRLEFRANYYSVLEKLSVPEIYSAVGFTRAEIVVMNLIIFYHDYVVLTNKK